MEQLSPLKLFPDCPRTKPIELFSTYHAFPLIFFPICPRLKSYCSLQSYQHQLQKTRTQTRRWLLLKVTLSFLTFYKEEETFLTICLQTGATFVSHNEIFKCVGDAQGGNPGFQGTGMTTGIFFDGKIWQVFLWVTWLSKAFLGVFCVILVNGNSAWDFWGGFVASPRDFGAFSFLPPFDHPRHLKSRVPPPLCEMMTNSS